MWEGMGWDGGYGVFMQNENEYLEKSSGALKHSGTYDGYIYIRICSKDVVFILMDSSRGVAYSHLQVHIEAYH